MRHSRLTEPIRGILFKQLKHRSWDLMIRMIFLMCRFSQNRFVCWLLHWLQSYVHLSKFMAITENWKEHNFKDCDLCWVSRLLLHESQKFEVVCALALLAKWHQPCSANSRSAVGSSLRHLCNKLLVWFSVVQIALCVATTQRKYLASYICLFVYSKMPNRTDQRQETPLALFSQRQATISSKKRKKREKVNRFYAQNTIAQTYPTKNTTKS